MLVRRLSFYLVCATLLLSFVPPWHKSAKDDQSKFRFRFVGPMAGIAWPRSPASRAIRAPTMPAQHRAASGNRPTAAITGTRSSTSSRWPRSAPWLSRRPIHNVVWAGTGEAWAIRDSDVMGNGIYKSTDAGKTWTHMGLDDTGRIGRIIVHPTNPDIVFACAAGPRHRAAAGARRVSHHRRRRALGARAVRRRKYRLLRPVHGPAEPAHALRGYVASGDAHLGRVQRRSGQRRLCLARRRHQVDAHRRPRTAEIAASARSTSRSRPPIPIACTR